MNAEVRKMLKSFLWPILLSAMMAGVKLYENITQTDLAQYGVLPRHFSGLSGIFFTPFIHADWEHVWSNIIPLIITGGLLFYFYSETAKKVLILIYVLSGVWLWIGGRENYHIGASNLVYGITAYIFFSGFIRRNTSLIAISLLMVFLYGSLIWGLLPVVPKISWEGHLFGAMAGLLCSVVFRNEGLQKVVYDWQNEDEADMIPEDDNNHQSEQASSNPLKIVYSYKNNSEKNGTEEH
jgi:membrane associated rhomboid family serine protease